MTARTHVATGAVLTLMVMQPDNIKYLTLSLAGGVIGSIIPDIDSKNSETNQFFDKVTIITILTIIVCICLEYFFNIGLYKLILKKNNIEEIITTVILFFAMCIIGSRTNHRSFTHSFLGLFLYTIVLYISLPQIFLESFIVGYLSHIILDLFNHKGLKLFYPMRKRLCFDLCDADGIVNNCIFGIDCIFLFIVIIFYCMWKGTVRSAFNFSLIQLEM